MLTRRGRRRNNEVSRGTIACTNIIIVTQPATGGGGKTLVHDHEDTDKSVLSNVHDNIISTTSAWVWFAASENGTRSRTTRRRWGVSDDWKRTRRRSRCPRCLLEFSREDLFDERRDDTRTANVGRILQYVFLSWIRSDAIRRRIREQSVTDERKSFETYRTHDRDVSGRRRMNVTERRLTVSRPWGFRTIPWRSDFGKSSHVDVSTTRWHLFCKKSTCLQKKF